MTLENKTIAVIGAGYMGSALLQGLAAAAPGMSLVAADASDEALARVRERFAATTTRDNREAVETADVVILSVKPGLIPDVAAAIREAVADRKVIISVAAGVTTRKIEEILAPGARVIRAMPNMPAAIGEGATAIARGNAATSDDGALALAIFATAGAAWETEEHLMDAVTALSGSGPAYVFLIIDSMIEAGQKLGLPKELARSLAITTLKGSASLAEESGEELESLISRITSPGGTTLAGLGVMKEEGLKEILIRGIEAAHNRSRELGSS